MTRSEELTVYRMFGISNRSIITAFIMELYAIASVTTLPAVLVTAGVIKVISPRSVIKYGNYITSGGQFLDFDMHISCICNYLYTLIKSILSKTTCSTGFEVVDMVEKTL